MRPVKLLTHSLIHTERRAVTSSFIFLIGFIRSETHGWESSLNLKKGAWIRCCTSWAHLSPPATAGIFLLTGAEPEEVKHHHAELHRQTVLCKARAAPGKLHILVVYEEINKCSTCSKNTLK